MSDRRDPTDPRAWLARARSNLNLASLSDHQGIFLEDFCFEAQQAVEKALKAICVRDGLDFPKTHSLVVLYDILESSGLQVPSRVRDAEVLTQFAVQARYPGLDEAVGEAEYRHVCNRVAIVVPQNGPITGDAPLPSQRTAATGSDDPVAC